MTHLKILYVCSELAPLVTTGGLGDVAGALPRALHAQGHDVRLVMPCYSSIPPEVRGRHHCLCVAHLGAKTAWGALRTSTVPGTEIPLYLIEHEAYFGRGNPYGAAAYEYEDNAERFCFFCLAALHGVPQTRWVPDIVHCHDWHTAVIPAYIKTRLAYTDTWRGMPTLFTIHNLAYQGRFKSRFLPYTGLGWDLFTPSCLEFYGDMNLMKAGIAFASKINTVSPRYAQEIQTPEYGEGLDGFLKTRASSLTGILNGVDYTQWHPAKDPHIAANYSLEDLAGKKRCKRDLQRTLGLPQDDRVPLIGMVGRVHWQKGIDLVIDAADRLMALGIQLVILGTGDPYFERNLEDTARRLPDRLRLELKFDRALSHQIIAGSDFFLLPSRYEPCGLTQLYSLAYGTVPIVRETGGLADSVRPVPRKATAKTPRRAPARAGKGPTGIVFRTCTPEALVEAVRQALALYRDTENFRAVRLNGMREDFSWERSSKEYVRLYREAIANP